VELSRRAVTALTGSAALALVLPGTAYAAPPTVDTPGAGHTVTFDRYSLLIDGARVPVWSGEVHPFRLPSPSLWADVLQKMRAGGYNAVSVYASWNYHSPAPGSYDFTGVRDLGRFLDMAAEAGLYVIARPGPYINGEVDGGGFPGWLAASRGRARSSDPDYLRYADEWLSAVNEVIAPRQYTNGAGTVVLYQLENEYASGVTSAAGRDYLAHLYAKARADGIDVPCSTTAPTPAHRLALRPREPRVRTRLRRPGLDGLRPHHHTEHHRPARGTADRPLRRRLRLPLR
jgi:Glycosyl hydrolases family 35